MRSRRRRRVRRALLAAFFALSIPAVWLISNHILSIYTLGDQKAYNIFFNSLEYASGFIEAIEHQRRHLSSSEPVYAFLSFLFSRFTDKITFISIFNCILFILLTLLMIRLRASVFLYPFVYTNMYFAVVLFSAERLKFAAISLILAFLCGGSKRLLFLLLAQASHNQAILFMLPYAYRSAKPILKNLIARPKLAYLIAASMILVFAVVYTGYSSDIIYRKLTHYSVRFSGPEDLWRLGVFFALSLIVAREKMEVVAVYIPLAIVVTYVGDERINVVGYVFTIMYSLGWNRGLNPITLALLAYSSYMTIDHISNIYEYGSAFVNPRRGN